MICSYCEETRQTYEPPLLRVPLRDLPHVEVGAVVDWHVPGSAYPGTEPFTVYQIEDYDAILLPPETSPDEELCYLCFAGRLWPALHQYVCNKPLGLQFNGWLDPTWADGSEWGHKGTKEGEKEWYMIVQ